MAEVRIRDLEKSYGTTAVVHGVSLDIADGEFVVLVGPSGCGKSTLLRMIAGLESISSGTISIGGRVVNNLPPAERDIAMVFQNYALYPHKTVAANMSFALKMARMSKAEIDARVNRTADILGLKPYLGRYPRALSGGQRQRVAMGRAIVRDPQVFLFDEPLSNLDAKLRVQMRSEIRELHQRLGTTTVYVTHDQIEAMSLADKIAVIDKGKLMQYGAPLDIYNNPHNRFVANFIGSPQMNLIDGELRDEGGALKLMVHGGAEILLGGQVGADFFKTRSVTSGSLGIRPQDIYLHQRRSTDDIELHGVVEVLERVGPRRFVYIQVLQTVFLAFDDQDQLRIGDEVKFFLPADKSIAFDLSSGLRLGAANQ